MATDMAKQGPDMQTHGADIATARQRHGKDMAMATTRQRYGHRMPETWPQWPTHGNSANTREDKANTWGHMAKRERHGKDIATKW